MSEAPRKLGKQNMLNKAARLSFAEAPTWPEVSATGEETAPVGQEEETISSHHRRSTDKSVAGGGVIVGGLVTTFLVAIFCYIRATRRKAVDPGSPVNSDSPTGRRHGEPVSPV
ncbi:hypothetical protein SASPL_105981 [Salvia splendens]|uniref:Uncharacterized protein n=1 Tax=Salvia splendens TaxID=180675 RepID=A0A8X9ABA3_SALSN|nr:hypothetical protein SASPL_105981 [Salvia splendens]